jgi:predicted transcriptional regulator
MPKRAVQIDADTDAILRRLAQERAAEPEAIVSDAVRLFDDLYGQTALGELDRRWAEFERTGESYTQDEVEAWIKTWVHRPPRYSPPSTL